MEIAGTMETYTCIVSSNVKEGKKMEKLQTEYLQFC